MKYFGNEEIKWETVQQTGQTGNAQRQKTSNRNLCLVYFQIFIHTCIDRIKILICIDNKIINS